MSSKTVSILKFFGLYDRVHSHVLRKLTTDHSLINNKTYKTTGSGNHRISLLSADIKSILEYELTHQPNAIDTVLHSLLDTIGQIECSGNNNAMSRRAQALRAIREYMPDIGKSRGNYLIEALLQLYKI